MTLPRVRFLIVPLALAAFVVAELCTLGQPLLEVHPWRQTHTAWTARIFTEQGIDLLRPQLPVLGPPWVVPFEFPLYQAVASLTATVMPLDSALRLVNLAAFVGTAWLLYDLLRRTTGSVAANVGALAFILTPLALVWSRTSMIEYTATLGGVGFLWAVQRRMWWAALAFGSVGALVKITTGAFYLLGGFLYGWRIRAVWVVAVVPLLLGAAWILYGDAVKADHPVAWQFTSGALATHYGGSVVSRLDPATWVPIAFRASLYVMGLAVPVWLVLGWLGAGRFWRAVLPMAPLSVIVLTQQYWQNDYYFASISPILAASVGLGAAWLWQQRAKLWAGTAMIVLAGGWALMLYGASPYWTQPWQGTIDRQWDLPAAEYIRKRTDPDDLVIVRERFWDPATLYYADRWGLMPVSGHGEIDAALDVTCPMREACR